MKTFSMGEALGSGFGMIAKRPLAVLLWGVLLYLPGIASILALAPFMGDSWREAGSTPDLSDAQAMDAFLQAQGWSILSNILSLIVPAVIGVAVIRLVLWPRTSDWAAFADAETWTMTWDARLMIGFGLALLVIFAGTGAATAVAYAPWASAYRQLRPSADEVQPESS